MIHKMRSHWIRMAPKFTLVYSSVHQFMHSSIVDWLVEMHKSAKLPTNTLFLSSWTPRFCIIQHELYEIEIPSPELCCTSDCTMGWTTCGITQERSDTFKLLDCRINLVPLITSHEMSLKTCFSNNQTYSDCPTLSRRLPYLTKD
jgi:hypothetical protein